MSQVFENQKIWAFWGLSKMGGGGCRFSGKLFFYGSYILH